MEAGDIKVFQQQLHFIPTTTYQARTMRARTNAHGIVESPASAKLDFPAIDTPSYIFHHPRANGDHVARYLDATSPDNAFDLVQAELYVKQFAKGLQNLGLRPGDKVALCSPNQLYSPVVIWGVLAAQCVFTGVSPTASVFGKWGGQTPEDTELLLRDGH